VTNLDIRLVTNEKYSKLASFIYTMSQKSGYKGIFSEKLLSDISLDFWVSTFNTNFMTHLFETAIMNVDGEDIHYCGYGF